MFFAKSYHPVIINYGLHTFTVAVVEKAGEGYILKSIRQCSLADTAQQSTLIAEAKSELAVKTKYLRAICHVTPEERVIRRVEIDGAKAADTTYLADIATNQVKIDPAQYDLSVLDSQTGQPASPATKGAVFIGLPTVLASSLQGKITAQDIYLERLGLTSTSEIGTYINLIKADPAAPSILLLEIGLESSSAYILSKEGGLEATKIINQGIESMLPVVQKELGLKDEESAKKLLYSNAFDFTSMSASLTKKLVKELQSSIGFFEVQTGLSITQLCCVGLPEKMTWIEAVIESQLGLRPLNLDAAKIQAASKVQIGSDFPKTVGTKALISVIASLD